MIGDSRRAVRSDPTVTNRRQQGERIDRKQNIRKSVELGPKSVRKRTNLSTCRKQSRCKNEPMRFLGQTYSEWRRRREAFKTQGEFVNRRELGYLRRGGGEAEKLSEPPSRPGSCWRLVGGTPALPGLRSPGQAWRTQAR